MISPREVPDPGEGALSPERRGRRLWGGRGIVPTLGCPPQAPRESPAGGPGDKALPRGRRTQTVCVPFGEKTIRKSQEN